MNSLYRKTAVITGGASGIGRAFVDRLAVAGMNLVISDIECTALQDAVNELRTSGAAVVGVSADVSSAAEVAALAEQTIAEFGSVNVVCLNAGVSGVSGPLESLTMADWEWTIGVNLWGVIHGVSSFLPLLTQHGDGHIVITASIAGLTAFPGSGAYSVTKHGVIGLAETLFSELRDNGSTLGVSCLCPGIVRTNIIDSERNRPGRTQVGKPEGASEEVLRRQAARELFAEAKDPSDVAELVYQAILEKQFWIFTDEVFTPAIFDRLDSIRNLTDPPGSGSMIEVYRHFRQGTEANRMR